MSEGNVDTGAENTDQIDDIFGEAPEVSSDELNKDTTAQPPATTGAEGGSDTQGEKAPQPNTTEKPADDKTAQQPEKPLSAKELAEATAKAVAETLKPKGTSAPAKPRGMTQDEYNKTFKRTLVDPNTVEALLSPDTPVADKAQLLQGLLDGVANHAVLRAKYITDYEIQEAVKAYQAEIAPFKQEYTAKQTQAAKEQFLGSYPGFDEKAHKDILGASVMAVNKELMKLPPEQRKTISDQQVMDMVAERAANIIKQVNPNFNPKAGSEGGGQLLVGKSAVPSATRKSFPAGAKVDTTKSTGGKGDNDPIDDLFEETE